MTREEILEFPEITEQTVDGLAEDIISYISSTNNPEFNLKKLLEECCELNEVIAKTLFKVSEEHKPSKERLWEEMFDVMLRFKIYMESLTKEDDDEVSEFMSKRAIQKFNSFLGYIRENKYQNTI